LGQDQEQFGESRNGLRQFHADIAYMRARFGVLIWAVEVNAAATIALLDVLLRHQAPSKISESPGASLAAKAN
jgi:hypothetical protein